MALYHRHTSLFLLVLLVVHACLSESVTSAGKKTAEHKEETKSRQKRSFIGFGLHTSCALRGLGGLGGLLMYGYGCHCGWGNSVKEGKRIVDELDRCCYNHDVCYNEIQATKCLHGSAVPYFTGPCIDHKRSCRKSGGRCAVQYCECDQVAAACFRQHYKKYDYNKRKCGNGDVVTSIHNGVKKVGKGIKKVGKAIHKGVKRVGRFFRRTFRRVIRRGRVFRRRLFRSRRRVFRRRVFRTRRRVFRRRVFRRRVFRTRRRVFRRRVFRRRVFRRRVFRRRVFRRRVFRSRRRVFRRFRRFFG